ncbi:unnamed protein product [Dicrocoelium dendriticum]|nr:unnamed protein product [Dicrocoelium dendriticum]
MFSVVRSHFACGVTPHVPLRHIYLTARQYKKEIRFSVDGKRTTIEGVLVPSERFGKVVRLDGFGDPRDTDPISRLGLNLKHTDIRILCQFLRPDGTVLPRNVSGISLHNQLKVECLIERARKAGLLPVRITADGEHVYEQRCRHQFNVYYDSDIVGLPLAKKKRIYKYVRPD